jgi:hypothetical protein
MYSLEYRIQRTNTSVYDSPRRLQFNVGSFELLHKYILYVGAAGYLYPLR